MLYLPDCYQKLPCWFLPLLDLHSAAQLHVSQLHACSEMASVNMELTSLHTKMVYAFLAQSFSPSCFKALNETIIQVYKGMGLRFRLQNLQHGWQSTILVRGKWSVSLEHWSRTRQRIFWDSQKHHPPPAVLTSLSGI